LLQEAADAAFPDRGIKVSVEAEDRLEAFADETYLASAVTNLLQNAVKFTKEGGRIILRGRSEGNMALIEVEDECGGLPKGKVEELFTPFVQKSDNRRGLGLGLSITREAIEAQKGSISVQNRPGRGCIFTVRLPVPAAVKAGQAMRDARERLKDSTKRLKRSKSGGGEIY
jgi:signal transduction histidine kinase